MNTNDPRAVDAERLRARISEIEDAITGGRMGAHAVFTQMRQLVNVARAEPQGKAERVEAGYSMVGGIYPYWQCHGCQYNNRDEEYMREHVAQHRVATPPTGEDTAAALTVDALAQEIRRVDGSHRLGAGALAEALMPFLAQRPAAPREGVRGSGEDSHA